MWKLTNKQTEEVKEEYLLTYEEAVKELEIDLQTMEAKIDELKSMTLSLSTEVSPLLYEFSLLFRQKMRRTKQRR